MPTTIKQKLHCFAMKCLTQLESDDVKLIKDYLASLNDFIEKCQFHENIGFTIEFNLYNQMGDELKDKIGQFFDIETYMCRVICSKFSPEIKMKWSIEGSESVITMSLKSINRIQKILLEIYMHKSTLRNLQEQSKEVLSKRI